MRSPSYCTDRPFHLWSVPLCFSQGWVGVIDQPSFGLEILSSNFRVFSLISRRLPNPTTNWRSYRSAQPLNNFRASWILGRVNVLTYLTAMHYDARLTAESTGAALTSAVYATNFRNASLPGSKTLNPMILINARYAPQQTPIPRSKFGSAATSRRTRRTSTYEVTAR